jgi:hypothetical protein
VAPMVVEIFVAMRRAATSVALPGGKPTMIRTGFVGYFSGCAQTVGLITDKASATRLNHMRLFIIVSIL